MSRLAVILLLTRALLPLAARAQETPIRREEQTAEQRYQFAEGLLKRNFHDLAETEFRFFLDKHADHELAPWATFGLIQCLRALGRVDETMSTINQFQTRWKDHELADKLFLWKGELLLQQSKFDQAENCFKRLILSPDSIVREAALYFLGQSYARCGETERSLATYAKLAETEFDGKHHYRPYAVFALAFAAQHQKDHPGTVRGYKRLAESENVPPALREESLFRLAEEYFVRGEFKDSIVYYELLLVEYPEGVFARDSRKRRTWAYLQLQDYSKAAELAKNWRERYKEGLDHEVVYIEGTSLAASGFAEEALPHFRLLAATAEVPEEYRKLARYQEVYCLLLIERNEDTARQAKAYVEDFPDESNVADVHYFAGEALRRLGKFREATEEFSKAREKAGAGWGYIVEAAFRLIECFEELDDSKAVAGVYRELSQIPNAEDRPLMRLRAGEFERRAGQVDAAIGDFEAILKTWPEAAEETRAATLHLAELYFEKKDFEHAQSLVLDLLGGQDKREGRGRLLSFLGSLYFQQEEYEKAEKYLRDALATKETAQVQRDAKFYLVGALLELKKLDEALALFGDIIKLPSAERPEFTSSLLFRLESLYYERDDYGVSEAICRWLLEREHPDTVYRASMRLSKLLIASQRLEEARKILDDLLRRQETRTDVGEGDYSREEICSLLGEVYLLSGEKDRAVSAFEKTLAKAGVAMEYTVRARWGLASILQQEGRPKQALHYAINAFVLANDQIYTPRAMFVAIQLLHEMGKHDEGRTTWQELQTRFPTFAVQKRNEPVIQALTAGAGDSKEKEPGG